MKPKLIRPNSSHLIILLLLIAASINSYGKEISPEEALIIGSEFFTNKLHFSNTRTSETHYTPRLSFTASKGDKACYHVIDMDSEGFVIISADSRTEPVLGYSLTGNYDNTQLHPNVNALMESYVAYIASIDATDGNTSDLHKRVRKTSVSPLLENTTWGQGTPFNNMCPEVNGKKCVTGCVATAMAQLMYYHKWPERGDGIVSYISQYGHNLNADLSESVYNWSMMLPSYSCGYSEESGNAVALLMRDCGYANKAYYGLNLTGADFHGSTFCNNFNYDKGIRQMLYACYDNDEWDDILITELDNGRPVLFGTGSHALVCDGYDNEGYFHLNFGWEGISDGYYLTSQQSLNCWDIMCGLEKDKGGESIIEYAATGGFYYQNSNLIMRGVLSNVENIEVVLSIAYENIQTHEVSYGNDILHLAYDTPVERIFSFYDSKKLEDGEYIVYPVVRKQHKEDNWQKCHFKKASQNFVELSVKDGHKTYINPNDKNIHADLAYIGGIYYHFDPYSETAKVSYNEDSKGMYEGEIIIPEYITIDNMKFRVTTIGESAFKECGWMNVTLPRSIKTIEKEAFKASYLEALNIPEDSELECIEDNAFDYCHIGFNRLSLPGKLNSIGSRAFYIENVSELVIPKSVNKIGNEAFRLGYKLRDIHVFWDTPLSLSYNIFTDIDSQHITLHVPVGTSESYKKSNIWSKFNIVEGIVTDKEIVMDGITYILRDPEMKAFLKLIDQLDNPNLVLPNRIIDDNKEYILVCIEDGAICQNNDFEIKSVFIPQTVEELRSYAFGDQKRLETVEFEENSSLWHIGTNCFGGCSNLESINFPTNLKKIDVFAFEGCNSLKQIDIPLSVNEICQDAFTNCTSLKDIYVHWTDPLLIHRMAFDQIDHSQVCLHVPEGAKDKYSRLAPWSLFGQIIEGDIPEGIEQIINQIPIIKHIDGGIIIQGDYGQLIISDMMGNKVGLFKNINFIPLEKGIYIFNIDGRTIKIMV